MNPGSLTPNPALLTTVQLIVSLFTLASRKLREKLVLELHFEFYIYIGLWPWISLYLFFFCALLPLFSCCLDFWKFIFFYLIAPYMWGQKHWLQCHFCHSYFRWKGSGNFIARHVVRKWWSGQMKWLVLLHTAGEWSSCGKNLAPLTSGPMLSHPCRSWWFLVTAHFLIISCVVSLFLEYI